MRVRRATNHRRPLFLFALFSVLPVVLLVAIPLQSATTGLSHQATARVAETAALSANAIAQQMSGVSAAVAASASPELFRPSSIPLTNAANPTRQRLAAILHANANIHAAVLLDAQGRVRAAEPWLNPMLGADFSFRDYFTGALRTEGPYVSETFISSSGDHPKLVAASQVVRSTGSGTAPGAVEGVVFATADVSALFQAYVDDFQRDHDVIISIFDQHGNLVASPGHYKDMKVTGDAHVADAGAGTSWVGIRRVDGIDQVTGYAPVKGLGWSVRAAVDRSAAFSSVHHQQSVVYLLAGAVSVVMVVGFVVLGQAMRRQERAERDRLSSDERTRTIIETAGQAFCEVARDRRLTEWNAKAAEVFGWSREEAVGADIVELLAADDRHEIVRTLVREMFESPEPLPRLRQIEGWGRVKDRVEPLPLDLTIWVTEVGGEPRLNFFARDISERKRLEAERELIVRRQRRLVEEMRAADQVKTDFISTISHELRTPLTSIVGYLEMLGEGYGGELNDQQHSMLEVVDRNSRRLLGLIEDVLTLSRIESGAFKMTTVLVDIAGLVTGVAQTMLPATRARDLRFDVDVASGTGAVAGDYHQLERVLLNLASNAVKFTPDGGRVAITAYRDADGVHLAVSDTGIGIPVEEQHRLFSRFFRASSAQERAIQGTGLGLTIVKSIVERHGGSVAVQSAPGAGTTVLVDLPIAVPLADDDVSGAANP